METRAKAKTYVEQLQDLADEYFATTGKDTATTQEIAEWAIETERWFPPIDIILRQCKSDFRRALSQQRLTDESGQPVRAKLAAKIRQGDTQLFMWGDTRKVPRKHVVSAMQIKRDQIVGQCLLIDRTERYWNDRHPEELPVQTLLDFREDVAEANLPAKYPAKPSEERTPQTKPR